MKLAFLLFEYFPYGGLQRDLVAIATKALERGHRVTVFTRAWHGDPVAVEGLEVRTLPSAANSNHASDADFAHRVAAQLDGFDRVVGFNKMPGLDWYYAADGCLAARYQGLKTLLPRYRSRLAMEAAVFGAGTATGVLSISPPQKALYQHHYGTPDARFVSLPPGIRRDRMQPADHLHRRTVLRAELGISEVTPMLLFVGSGFRTKGLDRALQALAGLPGDARLFVVGEDKAASYQRQAQRLGLEGRVHFMGGRDDVPSWLWAADLLVHPAYAENTGTVLLEAAIAGLPVLTTGACGYADYIRDADLGRVLDDPTPESLVAAARQLLAVDRPAWWEKAARFAERADIYSLTDHAVDAIEGEPPGGAAMSARPLFLRDDLAAAWRGRDPFDQAATQPGEVYRAREGRRTLRFEAAGRPYFLKYHGGIGWGEIIKNLTQAKAPVLGALSEVRAIRAVAAAGIDTLTIAGYGCRGANPARQESFLVTDELTDTVSLEELGEAWRLKPGPASFKWALIRRVGEIARTMHGAGVNHRDFYLGHFLIDRDAVARRDAGAPLYLIDLHRSQVRKKVPRRWRNKDVGGLYYSTARLDLTHRDLLRFVRAYTGLPLREALREYAALWRASRKEAEKIYRRYFEIEPSFPLRYCEHPGKDI